MSASIQARTLARRVLGYAGLALAIVASVGGDCDKTPTPPSSTTTTTTVPATTTSTTTTTTAASTSTTTTSVGVLDARIDIQNTPCIAPGSGPVSCTFTGAATTGGRTPYTFNWRFTNFANNQVITGTGQTERPELGCGFLAGVATFNIRVQLTVRDASNTQNTDTRDVQITRAAGACGT